MHLLLRRFFSQPAFSQPSAPSLASLVAILRNESGQSFALCRKALEAACLDLERARGELTKLVEAQAEGTQLAGQAKAKTQGLVGIKDIGQDTYGLIEVRCISDFVARNPLFLDLADQLVRSSTSASLEAGLNAKLLDTVGKLKEPITVNRLERIARDTDEVIGAYVHQQVAPGLGSVAALVGIKSFDVTKPHWAQKVANNIAKHVAGMHPDGIDTLLKQEYLFKPDLSVQDYLVDLAKSEGFHQPVQISRMIRLSL